MIENLAVLEGHEEDRIWHLSWSHSGQFLASCGEDKVIRVWGNFTRIEGTGDSSSVKCLATLEEAQTRTLRSCEWSPDDKYLASTSFDGIVIIWETTKSSLCTNWDQIASLEGHESEVKSLSWSFDGHLLATCGRDKKVWIWEKLDRHGDFECIAMLEGHTQDVKFVKFHHRMNVLFSSSYDDSIKIWMEDDGDWFCVQTLLGHQSTVWGLSINYTTNQTDLPRMASCGDDGTVLLWQGSDVDCRQPWSIMERLNKLHKFSAYSIDWNHDHGRILTAGGDNSIVLLSSNFEEESREVEAHANDINCVRWNPHSAYSHIFATCGDDGFVKVWQIK